MGYKVATKTITNRLKEIMGKLITPNQSSFVPGRQIVDNIIIYQEVLNSMRRNTSGKGYMLIKVDLEKAFDRISWSFIRDTLERADLPQTWLRFLTCIMRIIISHVIYLLNQF